MYQHSSPRSTPQHQYQQPQHPPAEQYQHHPQQAAFASFPSQQQRPNPNQPYFPPPPTYDNPSYHQPQPQPHPNAHYIHFPPPASHQRHHTVPASSNHYVANMSAGPASLPVVTPAYAHPHSYYIKIHSYSPASVPADQQAVNMTIQCTLLSRAAQPSSSSAPPPPPAKVLRLCFGSLPVQTKVARVASFPPSMVIQPVPGQDLALSCKIPLPSEVLIAAGKSGMDGGIGPGGSVSLYCEVMGVSEPGGGDRILDRIWFGELQFEGAGSSSMVQTRSTEGLTIGGWTGEETASAPASTLSVDTSRFRQPSKRPGSPLVSPRTVLASSSYQPPPSPSFSSFSEQSHLNASPQHGGVYRQYGDGSSNSMDGQGAGSQLAGGNYQGYQQSLRSQAFPSQMAYQSSDAAPLPHPGQTHQVPSPSSHQYSANSSSLAPSHMPKHWDPTSSLSLQPSAQSAHSPAQPSPGPKPSELSHASPPALVPQMVRVSNPRGAKATRRANNPSQTDDDESESGSGSAGPSRGATAGTKAAQARSKAASSSAVQKASLVLQGNLGEMAVGWNQEEWTSRRRLVQFWRRQEGSVIHAAFRPINQSDYVDNSIVISCIYREDTNECYVTSVDAIYLLEALIGVRFSVEEKNRIRRNLEGLKPDTVSKNKPATEDFFRLLMQLPKPKPRNIEKDVKVFKWMSFGDALKKIIGKYSVAYGAEAEPAAPAPGVPGPLQQPVYVDQSAQLSPGSSLIPMDRSASPFDSSTIRPIIPQSISPIPRSETHQPQFQQADEHHEFESSSTHSTPSVRPQPPVQTAFTASYDIDPLSQYFPEPYAGYDASGPFPSNPTQLAQGSAADAAPPATSSSSSSHSIPIFDQNPPQLSSSSTEQSTLVQTPDAFSLRSSDSFGPNSTLTTSYKNSISAPTMHHRPSLSLGSIPSFHGSSFDFADYFSHDAPFSSMALGTGTPLGSTDPAGGVGEGGNNLAVINSDGPSTYTPTSESSGRASPPPNGKISSAFGGRMAESASPVLGGGSSRFTSGVQGGVRKLGDDVQSLALAFPHAPHASSAPPLGDDER